MQVPYGLYSKNYNYYTCKTFLKKYIINEVWFIIIQKTEHGRVPMLMFIERPSKKLYPDYYKVIAEPIDMLTIEDKIKQEKYKSEEEILQDFKVIFCCSLYLMFIFKIL